MNLSNREIKFRIWDKKENEMFYSNMYQNKTSMIYGLGNFLKECSDIEEPIMQYTGLKDKNGVEIYEGDIVVYDDTPYNAQSSILTGIIKMENLSFKLISIKPDSLGYRKMLIGNDDFFNKKSKVIGNIYENPELLKGEVSVNKFNIYQYDEFTPPFKIASFDNLNAAKEELEKIQDNSIKHDAYTCFCIKEEANEPIKNS